MRCGIFCSVLGLLVLSGLPAAGAGREPVPLNDYARLGQRFTANQPFSALSVIVPSWMDAEGGLTLTLWESPQRGRLIVQQVFTAIPDNAGIELLIPASQPPGVYYWEIGERTGQTRIGLYADRLDADTEDCAYVDGVPDPRRRFLFSTPVPPFAYTDPARMLAILDSGAPLVERQEACRLLAVMGGRDAIPVLARLLVDPQLSHLARYALEPMHEAAVDAAFRAALQTLTGALRVGVINSIGVRRDVKAVAPLSACLRDPDAAVAAAAAAALGRIGLPPPPRRWRRPCRRRRRASTPRSGMPAWTARHSSLPRGTGAGLEPSTTPSAARRPASPCAWRLCAAPSSPGGARRGWRCSSSSFAAPTRSRSAPRCGSPRTTCPGPRRPQPWPQACPRCLSTGKSPSRRH
jgi:hypothetical protein